MFLVSTSPETRTRGTLSLIELPKSTPELLGWKLHRPTKESSELPLGSWTLAAHGVRALDATMP
jgi:hypothetical protein